MKHTSPYTNNNLKSFRLKTGLTQQQVATHLGFHTNERISKWEKGTKSPNLMNLVRLCELYNTSPKSLYPSLTLCKDDRLGKG